MKTLAFAMLLLAAPLAASAADLGGEWTRAGREGALARRTISVEVSPDQTTYTIRVGNRVQTIVADGQSRQLGGKSVVANNVGDALVIRRTNGSGSVTQTWRRTGGTITVEIAREGSPVRSTTYQPAG